MTMTLQAESRISHVLWSAALSIALAAVLVTACTRGGFRNDGDGTPGNSPADEDIVLAELDRLPEIWGHVHTTSAFGECEVAPQNPVTVTLKAFEVTGPGQYEFVGELAETTVDLGGSVVFPVVPGIYLLSATDGWAYYFGNSGYYEIEWGDSLDTDIHMQCGVYE
jgi:hypothetical protein